MSADTAMSIDHKMSRAHTIFDNELSDVEAHLARNIGIDKLGLKIKHLKLVGASMKPRLGLFRSENIFRGLTMLMMGFSIEGTFPHDVNPHFMPVSISLLIMIVFLATSLFFSRLNTLSREECLPIFLRKREIPELQPLFEKFLKNRYLYPQTVRFEISNIVQTLEKEKEALEIEAVIFRQSKANPWN